MTRQRTDQSDWVVETMFFGMNIMIHNCQHKRSYWILIAQ